MIIVVLSISVPGLLNFFLRGLKDSSDAQVLTVETVIAQSVMEEIRSKRWDETSGGQSDPLGSESETRATYDDIDDFTGLNNSPPQDSQGNSLTDLSIYREQVTVCYVTSADINTCIAGPTDYKKVAVTISSAGGNGPEAQIVTVMANW